MEHQGIQGVEGLLSSHTSVLEEGSRSKLVTKNIQVTVIVDKFQSYLIEWE
jgi:hypothetical protein